MIFDPQRAATAAYAVDAIEAIVRVREFGRFVHNPEARRIHASGLFFATCTVGDLSRFFAVIAAYYRELDRPQRWICGYELASFLTCCPRRWNRVMPTRSTGRYARRAGQRPRDHLLRRGGSDGPV